MKSAVIYWSGTGNTELMAQYISAGLADVGAEAEVFTVADAQSVSLDEYDLLVFGCPAMGAEVLEEDEFEPYFASIENSLSGKNVALFGSYGWGDGEWMRNWQERVSGLGANLKADGLIACGEPDEQECKDFAKSIA